MAIYLILALNVLVFVGVNASRVVFSLYGLNLGANSAGVGGILSMMYVFPLLLSWPIGVLADRFGARWLLLTGTASGAGGMLVPYFAPSMPSLYVASLLLGMSIALTAVIGQNLVGVLSKPELRTRNFSNYSLTGSAAILLGPLLAGFVIDHFGHASACLVIAVLMLLALALLMVRARVLPRGTREAATGGNLLHTLKNRRIWKMLAISSLAQLGNDLFQAFLPIYAHGLGLSASVIGGLLAALAVGSFVVRIGMLRFIAWAGERSLLAAAFFVGATVFALLPVTRDSSLLAILAFVFGLSLGCTQTLTLMLMFSSAETGRSGATVGLRLTVNNIARLLGPALFGAVGALAGLQAVFWINGVLMVSAGRLSVADKRGRRAG
jgi:predicted MFS family arabinose efflux permease